MNGTAVAARNWLLSVDNGRGVELPRPWGLVDVAAAAVRGGAGVVLVLADDGFDGYGCATDAVEVTGDAGGEPWRWRVTVDAASVAVTMLARSDGMAGPFHGFDDDPRKLCAVLHRLRELLGVDWCDSVGRTAQRLILSTHPRRNGGTVMDPAPSVPEVVADGSVELPWVAWRRELTRDEARAGHVHVFDANAQYLAAWSNAELGFGVPVHHGPGSLPDALPAGFWRIAGGLDGVRVPGRPLLPVPWTEGREWYSSATLRRALEVADGLELPPVAESWRWPRKSRFLRPAAERLRDARTWARAAAAEEVPADEALIDVWLRNRVVAGTVAEAVKALYTMQTGRFHMQRAAGSTWARPDWGHTIRAVARTNLHRRLWQLTAAPLAIATDALIFVDDEPDPAAFAQRIRLPLGGGLGQFKHEATAPAAAVREQLDTAGRPRPLLNAISEAVAA